MVAVFADGWGDVDRDPIRAAATVDDSPSIIPRPSQDLPMDFDLPAEHRMIRDQVREFCEEEIAPIAQEIEDEHRFPAGI